MTSTFFILFLAAHIVGDFYLQSETIATKKDRNISWLLFHSAMYTLLMFVVIIPIWSATVVVCAVAASLSHFIIDLWKTLICKKWPEWSDGVVRYIYTADQLLHLASLFAICSVFILKYDDPTTQFANHFIIMAISGETLIKAIVLILLIGKPVNVTFIRLFSHFKPVDEQEPTSKKAGATIGFLERLIIIVLFGLNQYAASGLILTAKSIVRYSKISENKAFGEYYLLGTLFSVLSAITLFLIIW